MNTQPYSGPERRRGTYGAEVWALRLLCTALVGVALLLGLFGSEMSNGVNERLTRISERVDSHIANSCCPCPGKDP